MPPDKARPAFSLLQAEQRAERLYLERCGVCPQAGSADRRGLSIRCKSTRCTTCGGWAFLAPGFCPDGLF